jgi:predicted MFS family arabinose efflux permease
VTRRSRRLLGPLAERDFALLWTAATISLMGDYAFRLAFITFVISASHSAGTLAAASAVLLVPPLACYLLGGVVGDLARSRRAVMVAADLLRFGAAAGIALVILAGPAVLPVVLLGVVIGVGNGFFLPASFAFLTEVLPEERLGAANSATSVSRQVGIIAGPVLGGSLVAALGVSAAFWFDAATFLASAALILAVRAGAGRARPTGPGRPGMRGILSEAGGGLRVVRRTRWLMVSLVVGALANAVFTGNLDVSVPLIVSPSGVDQAGHLGLFYAVQGAGALGCAVVLARLTVRRVGTALFRMLVVMAAAIALLGPLGGDAAVYLVALAYGCGLHAFNSLYPTALQSSTPPEMLSRIGGVMYLAFHGLMPVGTLLIGPLIGLTGPRTAAAATGTGVVLLALAALRLPSVRSLTSRTPAPPAQEPAARTAAAQVPVEEPA